MMQSTKQRQNIISRTPKPGQPHSTTYTEPGRRMLETVSKDQYSHSAVEFPRPQSNRVVKNRNGDSAKFQSPGSILADKFVASLDQYRETTLDQATKGIDGTNAELTASLNHLSYDADDNFEQLTAIEKTLKRPFSAEALIIQARADGDNLGAREEFSLQARLTAFRQLRHDKQQVLTQLWDEWEAVQMEIIVLTAEVCASGVINLGQDQADKMKDGQQGQFDNTLAKGKRLYDQNTLELNVLNNELQDLEESVNHITSNTNHAVVTMQQKYKVQKTKLFQGLHRHIELLASL